MKTVVLNTLITFFAASAFAQQPQPDKVTAQIRRGTVKMAIGLGLVGAGALTIPIQTKIDAKSERNRLEVPGAVMAVSGFGLIAWGARERWQAVRPQTTVGVMVGRNRGVQIQRVW